MGNDKQIATARAALDATMLEWEEATAFLAEAQAAASRQPPTGGGPMRPPGGIVPLKPASELLQAALRRERRAERAWASALQRFQDLAALAEVNITAPEDHYIELRRCIEERNHLGQAIA